MTNVLFHLIKILYFYVLNLKNKNMKINIYILFIVFISLHSFPSFSEKYICSYLFNDEPKSFTLERESDGSFTEFSYAVHKIEKPLFENNQYLILGKLSQYHKFVGYHVVFIDKISKSFHAYSITEPNYKKSKSRFIEGKCLTHF